MDLSECKVLQSIKTDVAMMSREKSSGGADNPY